MIKEIRVLIADYLLLAVMAIYPGGTDEKLEIICFCAEFFGKRVRKSDGF